MTYKISHTFKKDWFAKYIASKPTLLLCICGIVLVIGFYASVENIFNNNLWFSRSGSVLVVIAVISVYFNHYYDSEIQNIAGIGEGVGKESIQTLAAKLQRSNPEMAKQQAINSASGVINLYKRNTKRLPMLNAARSSIVKVEFISGVIGTLVWGFGDIFFLETMLTSC